MRGPGDLDESDLAEGLLQTTRFRVVILVAAVPVLGAASVAFWRVMVSSGAPVTPWD